MRTGRPLVNLLQGGLLAGLSSASSSSPAATSSSTTLSLERGRGATGATEPCGGWTRLRESSLQSGERPCAASVPTCDSFTGSGNIPASSTNLLSCDAGRTAKTTSDSSLGCSHFAHFGHGSLLHVNGTLVVVGTNIRSHSMHATSDNAS